MDLDLLADFSTDHQASLTGTLLSNLPTRELTHQNATGDIFPPYAPTILDRATNLNVPDPNIAGAVITKIEDIIESIAESILDEKKEMVIRLKTRKKAGMQVHDSNTGTIENLQDDQMKSIRFPSKSPREAWKFTALFRILELSHEALATGIVMTKRDIYYRDPELFMKQAVVDRYVDDIAYTLGVQRDALNVVAAAKGLIAGSFTIMRENDSTVDYRSELDGTLIPSTKDIRSIQLHDVQWILVIEKEATFRTLATSQYWATSLAGNGIILTAKGYPDIQTRQFLSLLSVHYPFIPVYCLVDYDPDGLGIMSTYKYGSMALAHENFNLAVPSIRWLGVRSADIVHGTGGVDKVGMLRLSKRDRRIAGKMLEKEMLGEDGREQQWRREVQVMLMLNLKAEIQVLSSGEGGLESWLDERLLCGS